MFTSSCRTLERDVAVWTWMPLGPHSRLLLQLLQMAREEPAAAAAAWLGRGWGGLTLDGRETWSVALGGRALRCASGRMLRIWSHATNARKKRNKRETMEERQRWSRGVVRWMGRWGQGGGVEYTYKNKICEKKLIRKEKGGGKYIFDRTLRRHVLSGSACENQIRVCASNI